MALRNVRHPEGLIHHSDRGIQYCCQDYTKILKDHHVLISMTEENYCYENAIAERINGILKTVNFFQDDTSITVYCSPFTRFPLFHHSNTPSFLFYPLSFQRQQPAAEFHQYNFIEFGFILGP